MKLRIFLLFLVFLLGAELVKAANPKFYIALKSNNKAAATNLDYLESQFSIALKKEFPCVDVLSRSSVLALLELERQKQLLGTGDSEQISTLAGAMGSDYLVSLNVQVNGNTADIVAFCMYTRRQIVIARAVANAAYGDASLDAVEKVAKELVAGLNHYEICPFKGPINVMVKTEFSDKKDESFSVYCNGGEGLYKSVISKNKSSDAEWKLTKTGKYFTDGSVTYNLLEETEIEEQNDCYTCPSGRKGARIYTEKVTKTAKVEGLSDESVAENQQIEDARTEITFSNNGTYTIKVKAASRKGDLKLRTGKHAEGTCDNQNPPPESIDKKADVPLRETTFGPFPGTSLDKILSHKDNYSTVDPITREKSIITYDFNLKRD